MVKLPKYVLLQKEIYLVPKNLKRPEGERIWSSQKKSIIQSTIPAGLYLVVLKATDFYTFMGFDGLSFGCDIGDIKRLDKVLITNCSEKLIEILSVGIVK